MRAERTRGGTRPPPEIFSLTKISQAFHFARYTNSSGNRKGTYCSGGGSAEFSGLQTLQTKLQESGREAWVAPAAQQVHSRTGANEYR